MRLSFLLIVILMLFSSVSAELINNNPDPNGEEWLSVDLPPLSTVQKKKIDAIPRLILTESYKNGKEKLPYTIDNTLQPFFRPVFNQQGGSCGQASGVGYAYTYEQNFQRGTSADITDNQYPTHYTYNFLNGGSGANGSWHFDGWDIIKSGGCPNVTTYGGMLWPTTDLDLMYKLWMSGYDKYESGMNNRVLEQIAMPVGTPEGLEVLKQWMNDHCDGSAEGGVAVFAAGVSYTFQRGHLPQNSYCPGESVVLKWDETVNHAMTFVGYNDSIRWDYNTDGKFTNDIDITGDGIVDMQDWEVGGLLMVNSWGTSWADAGKSWVMYRTLAQSLNHGGIYNKIAHSIRTRESSEPSLRLNTEIKFTERSELKIMAGISNNISANEPEYIISFPYFDYQGGAGNGMTGDENSIKISLDISPLLKYASPEVAAKFFLCVEHKGYLGGKGKIKSFSVSDNQGNEFISKKGNVRIENNLTTIVSAEAITSFNNAVSDKKYSHKVISANAPATFELLSAYPNPFNPSTSINFSLVKNDKLSLFIYNVKGEIVDIVLENKYLSAGNYTVNWNSGEEFTSGIYYYGIESESGIKQIKKMTLLK